MPRIISVFHGLNRPRPDNMANITDIKDWCVHSSSNNLYYLLNDGSYDIADLSAGLSHRDFYFDTEADCHEHAAGYYEKQGFSYPYLKEWSDCVPDIDDGDDTDSVGVMSDDSGSQVMEFI